MTRSAAGAIWVVSVCVCQILFRFLEVTDLGRLALHHGVVLLEAVAADAKVGNLEVLWGRGGIISCSYLL